MKCNVIFLFVILFVSQVSFGQDSQDLQVPSFSYSKKKTTYITLDNGDELKCNLKDLDFKKGIIDKIKVVDLNGKKVKMKPENIKCMYLPQSGLDKLGKIGVALTDAKRWSNSSLDQDIISKGYIYFEKSPAKVGRKNESFIFQVLNVSFSDKIKIYHDPFAKETASLGIAGVKVAGGNAKSYYFKKGDDPAYRLKKKDYKDEFKMIWSDCPALIEKYGDDPKWSDFVLHVFEYTNECK